MYSRVSRRIQRHLSMLSNSPRHYTIMQPTFPQWTQHAHQLSRGYSTPIAKISMEDKMIIVFTCKVCSTRSSKPMSKKAYTSGVVMIKCDCCKNTHLIADHLGWFDSQKPPGTIEEMLKGKETVTRMDSSQWLESQPKGQEVDMVNGVLEILPK